MSQGNMRTSPETRESWIAWTGGLMILGLLALVGMAVFDVQSPGVLDQSTAFVVLGGLVGLLGIATAILFLTMKGTLRRVDAHENEAARRIGELEEETNLVRTRSADRGISSQDMEQAISRHEDRLATRLGNQEDAFERLNASVQDALEQHKRETEAKLEALEAKIDNAIREEGYATTERYFSRQDGFLDEVHEEIDQRLSRQEAMVSAILHEQDQVLAALASNGVGRAGDQGSGGIDREVKRRPLYPVAKYEVTEIPDVSASEARQLRRYGVNLTDTLLHTDIESLAASTGIDEERLERWRATAELMAIDGIGAKLSARLVDAGIASIDELARLTPDELSGILEEAASSAEDGQQIFARSLPQRTEKIIDQAQQAAMRLEHKGTLA